MIQTTRLGAARTFVLILLLAVALVPAFLSEAHFNARTYTLDFGRTPERRELDYVRQTAASVETAKEVKIFGLNAFLIERYRKLSGDIYLGNKRLAIRRAGWGGALALRTPAESGWLEAAVTIIPFALLAWALVRHARRATAP